jgi:pyruvate,water dikinase
MAIEKKSADSSYIKWLYELDKSSGQIAGGKGANLAEMFNAKMPVPPAFIVTTAGYEHFTKNIKEEINKLLDTIDVNKTAKLDKTAKQIRELIISNKLPEDLAEEIIEAYENISIDKSTLEIAKSDALNILQNSQESIFVAVRSSATTEDLDDASFAGQQETYLNVKGNDDLLEKVKTVFASLFTARAIYYRKKKGFANEKFALAVVVQKMVDSDKSGVMFSSNPVKNNDHIVIEAVFGLGEGIVSGKIKPDKYELTRDLEITEKSVANKKKAMVRNSQGEVETIPLNEEKSKTQVLEEGEIKTLANHAIKIQDHYKKPQDIEFAVEAGEIFIVQSRPITTQVQESPEKEIEGTPILEGLGASPGIGSGKVKIVKDISEMDKVQEGDILVTEMTNPDMVVTMQKASGIVTNEGGLTCHAAIVSREMGIPCIVGTDTATEILKENQLITVDGFHGKVFEGASKEVKVEILPIVPTKTKVKVIVDLPEAAERAALTKCDGIGLMRLEGIIASSGIHPNKYIQSKNFDKYIATLEKNIELISKPFKEIWIRTSDIRSDEYDTLEGAPPNDEPNPMMGDHAIRFSLKHPELFKAELTAINNVAKRNEDKTFGFMIPLVISPKEVIEAKRIAVELGVKLKKGIMVETPASAFIIKDLLKVGVDFISFGTNDLTQFTLAVDRNNQKVQNLFNETHPAVLNAIKRVIRTCKEFEVESSICGQAASKKEMVKHLIDYGIDSVSVNADAAKDISELIAEIEKENPEKEQPKKQESKPEEKDNQKEKKPQQIIKEIDQKVSTEIGKKIQEVVAKKEIQTLTPERQEKQKEQPTQQPETKKEKKPVPSYVADINTASNQEQAIKSLFEGLETLSAPNNPEEYTQYENNFMQKQVEGNGEEEKEKPKEVENLENEELDEILDIF